MRYPRRAVRAADVRRLDAETRNYTEAIRPGGNLAAVVAALQATERRRADLTAKLEHLDGLARVLPRLERRHVTAHLENLLRHWRGLFRAEPVRARQMLRKLLAKRLVFEPHRTPGDAFYEFHGEATYGRRLSGIVVKKGWCPRGDSNTRYAV